MTTMTSINTITHTSTITNTVTTPDNLVADTSSPAIFELPRRFDIHEVDRVVTSLRALSADRSSLSIDASAVEMIDLAGLAALTAATEASSLEFRDPSVAFLATVRYTGHDVLAACCDLPAFLAAA